MQQHKEWMGEYAALLELESSVKDVALIAWDLPREHVPCLWWVGRGESPHRAREIVRAAEMLWTIVEECASECCKSKRLIESNAS